MKTLMPITQIEAHQIVIQIRLNFQQVLDEYDLTRYPANDYARFKALFSELNPENNDIKDAMVWKWGHWGKLNFPQHHHDLIAEIQNLWPQFVKSGHADTSNRTFEWWCNYLNRRTAYITVAFITHLIHHEEPLPIIDQHNFRAMNSLIVCLRPNVRPKKKPSNWNDITYLKTFMSLLLEEMEEHTFSKLDRFLMMYGRNYAAR